MAKDRRSSRRSRVTLLIDDLHIASSVALCSAVGPVLAAISAPLRAKELARGQAAACRAQCPQQNMAPLVSTPCPMIAQLQC